MIARPPDSVKLKSPRLPSRAPHAGAGMGEDGSSPLGDRAVWAGAERASAPQQHPGVTARIAAIARELAERGRRRR